MTSFRTLICTLCLVPLSSAAVAQDDDAVDRMRTAVGTYVSEYFSSYGDTFDPQAMLQLNIVALQRAIAETCDDFEVDEARYGDVMNRVLEPYEPAVDASGPRPDLPFTIAMSGYSMLLGANIAVGAYDPDAMCALGAKLRQDQSEEGRDMLLIWSDANKGQTARITPSLSCPVAIMTARRFNSANDVIRVAPPPRLTG